MADDDLGYGGEVLGSLKSKLVETKEKWAKEGRALTGTVGDRANRLPPGQHATQDWPVLDLGQQPAIDRKDWKLTVAGQVARPVTWDFAAFLAQPQVTMTSDLHCVTTWSRFDNTWQGVSARHFLDVVQPKPAAAFVIFHGHDGYTTNVPLDKFAADDVILAHSWEGQPIGREHGGPVRPIIPGLYLWKSAKWLKHIMFLEKDAPGYWEARGYHDVGDPWKEERYR